MTHPSADELSAKLQAAPAASPHGQPSPERVRYLREFVASCPTFAPGLLALARSLLLTPEPGVGPHDAFAEIQRLLEQAVQASQRSAPAVIELAHFLDTFRNSPQQARPLFEEGAAQALKSLEDSWAGLLRLLTLDNQLTEALALAERAERLFPDSARIQLAVAQAREAARSGSTP